MASRRGPDNSCRFSINGTMNGVPWANVFHAQLATTSAITSGDLSTWLLAVSGYYKAVFGPLISGNAAYSIAKAIVYTPGNQQVNAQLTMTGTGGQAGSGVNDNSCCKVLSWTSNVYWRGGKPRTYLPGVVQSDTQNSNALTPAALTALASAGNTFRTDVNGQTNGTITGSTLGFVSFFSGNVALSPGVFHAVTGAAAHPRLGSQRRRLGRWTA